MSIDEIVYLAETLLAELKETARIAAKIDICQDCLRDWGSAQEDATEVVRTLKQIKECRPK